MTAGDLNVDHLGATITVEFRGTKVTGVLRSVGHISDIIEDAPVLGVSCRVPEYFLGRRNTSLQFVPDTRVDVATDTPVDVTGFFL